MIKTLDLQLSHISEGRYYFDLFENGKIVFDEIIVDFTEMDEDEKLSEVILEKLKLRR